MKKTKSKGEKTKDLMGFLKNQKRGVIAENLGVDTKIKRRYFTGYPK